ncbi:RcpC/CpaB family pilus assembly protein [Arthrobacter cryoconiti]|uniref:RcpC/CpaB family pilus assembly protein n=1 Tax=Arthrobacter cryoconiti TaxID=748907 RepID=A0ABV8QZG3_9MICC|nr:RcpC/CpaB family pilus assembly protein [Arthrobacter cryoconiti]MCC9069298.1 RcpC/CpaB family pilus assembly protein [Arthrobacter cryoconiti]
MRDTRTARTGPFGHTQTWQVSHSRQSTRSRLRRWVLRRRRLLAAFLLCAAAAIAVQQLTPAEPATTTILIAARDLPAGHTLTRTDLVEAKVSPVMVPDEALRPDDQQASPWAGSQVSGPVRRGEVVTDAALLGKGLLVGAPPGSQAVPVRLADPSTVQLLHQGQLVNIVLTSSQGIDGPTSNEVLASSVPVLWTSAFAASSGGLLPSTHDSDGLVVIAATASQSALLAGASVRGKIFLVLVS